ncbi:MAG TPA: ABC transporter substrate-binding protein, partial [Mizugakiibacter sp.]|nr:ABC transporter substrate-binding protein [Mizugakiibacter sp.]
KQISVDFVFHRNTAGQWKAYDVVIEGISYVASYRSQVGEEIRHVGLTGLIKRLQKEGGLAINKLNKPGGSRK